MYFWFLGLLSLCLAAGIAGYIIHPLPRIKLIFLFITFFSIVLFIVTEGYFRGRDVAQFYGLVILILALLRLLTGVAAIKIRRKEKE